MRGDDAFDLWPTVVFCESDYYQTIASASDFVNHTPQSYFQRHNVLFIGTSLDDINIRRWLSSSFRERFEQRVKYLRERCSGAYDDAEYEAKLESKRHFWLRTKDNLSDKTMEGIELIMENLGAQVLWFDKYNEIQEYLGELSKPCTRTCAE